jgi:hypothetical protein
MCQRQGIQRAEPICQSIPGQHIDAGVGRLLVETVTPMALEVTLTVHAELQARAAEADRLRARQVERARYEADVARRRFMQVDPENRLVADELEASGTASCVASPTPKRSTSASASVIAS